MPKDNNYTLEQIKKNLLQFQKKIIDKSMNENFWIIADRSDFKPLKKITKEKKLSKKSSKNSSKKLSKKSSLKKNLLIHSIKELKDNFLDGKEEYYKDKNFANIKVTINDKILNSLDNIREYKNISTDTLVTVQIIIFKVSSTGYLNFADKSELKVKYTLEDFRKFHFKLKNLEVLMRLVTDSVIKINSTNSTHGITYKTLLEKINKNK